MNGTRLYNFVLKCSSLSGARRSTYSVDGPAADKTAPKGMRVLLVDDSPTNLSVTGAALNSMGCTVITADGGIEALNHVNSEAAFDLILIDYHMPEMSGPELASQIRNIMKDAAPTMIALTADRSPEIFRTCRASGMRLVLNKPVSKQQMSMIIDSLKARMS